MEQHPIPQQISSYEFKLVGEMTLKQFAKAAGGIIIALIINATPLVFFIKWPLMFLFGAGGLALAFVPFQDRPLEVWLQAFIKSIYAPTIFLYKKQMEKNWLDIDLSKKTKMEVEAQEAERKASTPVKEGVQVKEFIESLPSVNKETKSEKVETGDLETTVKVGLDLKKEKLEATGEAVFGEIPMPDIPDVPNVIVGMVTDKNSKIVEGAIVEIQDKEGNPSRVLKTNQLGQFRTLTQLGNGTYLIIPEKDNYEFDRVEVELKGEIVKPIKIIAK